MLKPENQADKARFDKLKEAELERGREDETAVEVAAAQVKELRKREGKNEKGASSTRS
jgi:hypothetical protein